MKTIFVSLLFCSFLIMNGQTATNWTSTDCSGNPHELFADLDAGKVAVIIWVMPCATCINEALAAKSEIENANAANPGKVKFYVVDDYGNTNCSTLSSWCASNGIDNAILISNKLVKMDPYGEAGMPKVVIAAGIEHKIFYNDNAPYVTANAIKNGLDAALAAPTGIKEEITNDSGISVFPNPSDEVINFSLLLQNESDVSIAVYDQAGKLVSQLHKGKQGGGTANFKFQTTGVADGIYFLVLSDGTMRIEKKFAVVH